MSHFYATIPHSARRTTPTARGHRTQGITTEAASWEGAVQTYLWYDQDTMKDMFEVRMIPWRGSGDTRTIAKGEVGNASSIVLYKDDGEEVAPGEYITK